MHDGRRNLSLEEELRKLDKELNGPKDPQEEPKEPERPKAPAQKPPWAGPLLLD
jgi:hypothetical protein